MKKYIQDRKRKQDLWSVQEKMANKRPNQSIKSPNKGGKVQNEDSHSGIISTVNLNTLLA